MTMIIGGQTAGPARAPRDLIKDSDTQDFMRDVIEASRQQPVIVDFWAPWCGPCKQLGPALEKVVREANGKVRMVKINVDENQQLAAQMRIQSIPAVYAFVNGQPVDGFMGALPESQIKQFVDRLGGQGSMAEEIEAAVAEARLLIDQDDQQTAAQIFAPCSRSTASMPAPLPASRAARSRWAISRMPRRRWPWCRPRRRLTRRC